MMATVVYVRRHQRRLNRQRIIRDRSNPLDSDSEDLIIKKFRLSRLIIFSLIDTFEEDHPFRTRRSRAIPPALQVMVSLRFFATGSLLSPLSDSFGISKSSSSRIIRRFAKVIVRRASQYIAFDMDNLERSPLAFYSIAGFPNVLGCVDGTQFAIKSPTENEYAYVNRKGFHSINAQLVCGPDLAFLDVVVKYPGSSHDSFVFQCSALSERFRNGSFSNGWLLGDSGYPLLPYLLTPFDNPTSSGERSYNSSHKKTRVKVECAIGVLKGRFLALSHKVSGPLLFSPSTACEIITCCCCLHNIAIRSGGLSADVAFEDDDNDHPPANLMTNAGRTVRSQLVAARFDN